MARSRSLIPWLLVAVVALIAYGSLYPFNFKPDAIEGGVLQALSKLSWARAGRSDHIANVLLYLPLGFCLFLLLASRLSRPASIIVATLLGASLSLMVEIAQVYVSARVPSLKDLALNTLGASLGACGGLIWKIVAQLMHLPSREERPMRDPAAGLVLASWLVFRLAPFAPELDLGKLKTALRPLFAPHWDALAVFMYLACWLLVNQAIASLVRRSRRLETLLLVIAVVLVGRLIVTGQTLMADELIALLLLVPMLVLMHRLKRPVRRSLLLFAVAAVLLIEGLAPFDFSAGASSFDWWPFRIWFEQGAPGLTASDWISLLGRVFLFSALLWLLCESGVRVNSAIVIVTAASFAIELAQLWLPDQTGSITEPALALATGLLFRALDRTSPHRAASDAISPPARSR